MHCPSSCCQIPYPPLLQRDIRPGHAACPSDILVGMFLWYSTIFDVLCKGYAKPLFCSHDPEFGPWCNLVQPIGGSKLSRLQQSLLWATAHLTTVHSDSSASILTAQSRTLYYLAELGEIGCQRVSFLPLRHSSCIRGLNSFLFVPPIRVRGQDLALCMSWSYIVMHV